MATGDFVEERQPEHGLPTLQLHHSGIGMTWFPEAHQLLRLFQGWG
jgi:hypothetical protein